MEINRGGNKKRTQSLARLTNTKYFDFARLIPEKNSDGLVLGL